MSWDVIVVGTGGMGSAAVLELARRGRRVLGLDRYGPAHALGSSHGGSRIYRQSYLEDPAYVPLLLRAWDRWHRLVADSGTDVFVPTGGLFDPSGARVMVTRGGAWCDWQVDCVLSSRRPAWATERAARVGFRMVRDP